MPAIRTVIGVMGGGEADATTTELAYEMGAAIAREGWVLLNGGRACGVMDASARGAREAGGLVVGVLPDSDKSRASEHLDIAVVTDMGYGRNYVNVLSSDVVVALPGRAGTLSEIALSLSIRKPVVVVGFELGSAFDRFREEGLLVFVDTPEEAIREVKRLLGAAR
ncbi:MAG: hypothetical protein Kow0056_12030 [Coriobacteriia bacterium]